MLQLDLLRSVSARHPGSQVELGERASELNPKHTSGLVLRSVV